MWFSCLRWGNVQAVDGMSVWLRGMCVGPVAYPEFLAFGKFLEIFFVATFWSKNAKPAAKSFILAKFCGKTEILNTCNLVCWEFVYQHSVRNVRHLLENCNFMSCLLCLVHDGTERERQYQHKHAAGCRCKGTFRATYLNWTKLTWLRLHSHKHEYEYPVYGFRQTRVCVYFNGGRSHTYEHGLPVNFTRTSIFCAGHVFIQPVRLSLIHIWRCRRSYACRSRWSPYH